MAHRNRWFTELNMGGSFHGYATNHQRVAQKSRLWTDPWHAWESQLVFSLFSHGMGQKLGTPGLVNIQKASY